MEFQAVVMAAGRASRMTELTYKRPKCLLPIGNKPMIWYTLKMLEKAGFEEAMVIVQENFRNEVAAVPQKFGLNIRLDVQPIPKNEDFGTADSLRLVHDKIKVDTLIVSSDLVTDVALHKLFDMHRTHQSSITALFCPLSTDIAASPIPGPKAKYRQEYDVVGLDQQTSRLVFMTSEADCDEEVTFPKSVFKLFPHVKVQSNLVDAHLYIFKKWVVDYVANDRSLSMLKGEVLPQIVRKQFRKPAMKIESEAPHGDPAFLIPDNKRDIYSFATENEEDRRARDISIWNDHRGNLSGPYHSQSIRCFAYVMKEGFCLRANTLASYCELNRQVIKRWSSLFPNEEQPTPPKGQVGADCLIGESPHFSEKCSIKHSILGQNCHIEDKVRIINCIIMDNVTVKEGTSLQGSILLDNVTIEPRCDIKDCVVASEHGVHSGSKSTNEILVDGDRLMEI